MGQQRREEVTQSVKFGKEKPWAVDRISVTQGEAPPGPVGAPPRPVGVP